MPRTAADESNDRRHMHARWGDIFAVAHEGFTEQGRGFVYVSAWDEDLRYITSAKVPPAIDDANLRKSLTSYDPREQVIVVVRREVAGRGEVFVRYELRRREG